MRCNWKWLAPKLYPGGYQGHEQQTCCLKEGHSGPHQSLTKVQIRA